MSSMIKVHYCKTCDVEAKNPRFYRHLCGNPYTVIEREKERITGKFVVVDWFSSRSSAGLVVEDKDQGIRKSIYMSDLFKYLDGTDLGEITFEETKKGTAYSWKVVE
ncbi:hypothetical protein G3M81_04985 [Bacillus paralicheniformis]|uniref:hypothetical protein n=1 Tax=Bacillus paralicheniformis TaxID=1648923 RepID=UPI0013EEECD7|nr:hypothetical protein [Bacillus paralicheniformis]QII48127.1 hypothetical protein G3M81_04985 [Bacillus paralicheniformis]